MKKLPVNKFWGKVLTCHHEWSKTYSAYVVCSTPHCSGTESKCKKCRVYETTCGCGSNNGISGWPERRRQEHYTKWSKKRLANKLARIKEAQ